MTPVFKHVGQPQAGPNWAGLPAPSALVRPAAGTVTIRPAPPPTRTGLTVRHSSSSRPAATICSSSRGPPSVSIRRYPRPASAAMIAAGLTSSAPATITSAFLAAADRSSAGAASVVTTIVRACPGPVTSSGPSGSRPAIWLDSTAIGGVGGRPDRSPGQVSSSCTGRYRSILAVPAPTTITSARLRSTLKIARSARPDRPPDRPPREAAPSALATMFARTQGLLAPGPFSGYG